MKKELLETIDETVENICKWANEEFKPKKPSSRDILLHHVDDDNDEMTNEQFTRQLKIISYLSELLHTRAAIRDDTDINKDKLECMLKAIHEENKAVLSLLCSDDIETTEEYIDVSDEVDKIYDELFYGKETTNE